MRITTLVKNYFFYFVLLVSLFGYNSTVYSQCPTVTNPTQSFCDVQSPTIASLVATNNGGGIKWYATASSVTALSNGTGLVNGEDYFADDNTGTCGTRQSVVVTIYSTPTGANFQGVCVTSANLATPSNPQFVISGNNLHWYTTPSGGTALLPNATLSDNTIYYISQTNPNTGCETSRLQLFVNVGIVPVPTGSAIQEFCNTGSPITVGDLVASGTNNWYLTSTFGVPLDPSTSLINGQFYYATTLDPPCESSDRLEVLVNIYEPNDAGNDGARRICIDNVPTTAPFDLFSLLGGTPDATGVWTGPIATSNGFQGTLNPSTMTLAGSPYVFTYTVSSALCATDTSTVTITINATPTVTVTTSPVCSPNPATVTATPSPAGTYTYVWTVPVGATNPGNVATFTTTIAGVYSVIATNTSTTCSSASGQTTVVINPRPTVTVTSPPVCQGALATVTATPAPSGTYTYVWTVPVGATNPGNVATFTTNIAGVYSVVITNTTTTCTSLPGQTTVVINPTPTVTVTSLPVCSPNPATVTATPNPAGTYSYVWTVPVGATNPGNVATFSTTIPGVYSVIATNTATTCPAQPAQTTVVINPVPTVTVASAPVCSPNPATVTASPSPVGTYTYVWTVPVGATNPGNVATFTTTIAGVYSVIATNTVTTCSSQPAQTTVVINPVPTVTVTSPPVCSPGPATVTATPSPAGTYTYVWTVPAGATNPGNVATFTTTTAGVYSVIATNTATTCPSQPAQTTVVINPLPTVTVTSAPVCAPNPATVTATPNPAGTYTYVWTVPVGATNPGNVATFTTTIVGVYSVIATNTATTCPSQPAQTTVVINPIPTVTVTSPPVCAPGPATVTATPNPAGTYTYVWTVPVGATNPGNVATFTTTIAGVYSVIATNTATTCPSQPAQTTVVINLPPTVTVTSPPVCSPTPATVTATPTPAGTYTYVWTVPAGATNPGNVATFTTTTAGVYSVIATNTATTCPSQPAQTTVVINLPPTVTVTSPPVCSPTPATVTATPNPAGTYTYVWTVPAGATNPGNVATFTTTTAGVYSVIATNTATACPSQPAQTTVVINLPPTVTVTSPPVCSPTPATVTATPNPAGTYTYVWTVPAGATNPGNVATFTTTTAGVYSVIATNTATTCLSQPAQTTVVINLPPTVTVTSPPVCSPTPATVTATPNPAGTYTYVWTVPAGATNPGNVATFTTTTAGVYSVIATNTATTCPSQPAQTTVVINLPPTVTVTSPPVCSPTPATVTATPNPAGTYTYVWTVPAGATNPGNVATFTTTTAGVYSVIATNTATTCPSQPAQTTVVINLPPTVTVTSPPVCSPTPATVTATPNPVGTYTYVWTVPAGATNPGNVATFTTTTAGVYSVIATNTATTCPSQPAQTTVVINLPPTVTVTSPPVCAPNPATVTATPNPAGTYTYVWTVPVGATNPGNVATFTTTIPGVYSVIATNTATTCPAQPAQTTVVINPIPTVTVTSSPVCAGTPATVTATPSPAGTYTYVWTVPVGATNPGNVAAFTTTIPGVYSVIATNTSTTCPSQPAQTTVVINPAPTVTVTSPPVCAPDPATVTATPNPAGTYTYVWTVPVGATNPGNVATFTTTTAGVYSVIATNTATTCPSQPAQTTVVINPVPTVTVTSPPVCSPTPATVTATPNPAGTYTYVWTVPVGATNPGNVATFTTTIPGVYTVIATNTTTTCPAQPAQTTVVINLVPTVTVTSPPVCAGTPATVTATPNPAGTYTYVWTVPVGATNPGNVATFTTTTAGVYSVIATNIATTCPAQPAQTTVVINPAPTVTVTSPPVCSPTPATVTATPNPAGTYTYVWTVPVGATNPGNVATFTTTIPGVYSVIATNTATTCPAQPAQTTVVINPLPTVTVTSPPVCLPNPATVTATPTPAGTYTYVWTVPVGATNPGNVATFTTTIPGVYSVIATNTVTTCPAQPAQTTVVINPVPTVTVTSPPVCAGTPATVTATPNPAGTYTYVWTVPVGATNPGDVATFTTTTAGDYSVIITSASTTCPSQPAQTTVVINPVPDAGNDGTLDICSNQNPVDLFASLLGTPQAGGTWSPALASGTGMFNPAVDVSGAYTYTVTGISPCVDDTATVTVTVTPGPEAGTDNSLIVCVNNPSQDLFLLLGASAQTGGTWSPAMVSGTGVFDPAVDPQGNYVYTLTGTSPCSNDFATVSVTVNPIPDAGTDGTKTFCSNGTSEDLFLSLGGTPQAGGTWSPVLASGTGVFDPTVDTAATYTYTVGSTCVTPSTATVTVSITTAPNSGVAHALTTCADIASLDLTTGLDGTQDFGTWSDDDATGALTSNIFNPSVVGAGTYHFTYVVLGTLPCGDATSIVTVTVNPLPNPGTAVTPPSVCTSVGTVDLDTLLTGQDAGGTWSATTPVDISAFVGGTYTYTYSVTNSCGTDTTDVQFIVLPNPILTTTNIANTAACVGTDAVVNLSGMVDGTYTLNYSLSGSNTLANQTATVVISGGTGSFTIPTASLPNTGSTTITFNTIQDTTSTCQVTLINIIATITVNPLVDIDNTNIAVSSICLGSIATVEISNAVNLPDGTYQFDYSIPTGTPATGNSGDFVITGGVGQFTVPASVFATAGNYTITISGITTTSACSNTNQDANITFAVVTPLSAGTAVTTPSFCNSVGTVDLDTLLTGQDAGGTWSTPSPIDVSAFAAGTYTYTYSVTNACGTDTEDVQFIILENPILASSNVANSTACVGVDVVVNLTGMVDGTYDLNYSLSGTNTLANQTVNVVISGGAGSFTIPAASVPNTGITIITFNTIQNSTSTCQSTLTNVAGSITINPLVDIDNTNIAVSSVCLGSNAVVDITNAVNLPDGTYQFDYTIPTGTPTTGNSGDVTITAGVGQFTIPSSVFATVGDYTLTINSITTTTGCSNTTEDANITFSVVAPLTAGTAVTPPSFCTSTGTVDLDTLLTGQDAGGTWSTPSPIDVSAFAAGTYTYTYSVTNACGTDTEDVQFIILENPILASSNVANTTACIGLDVVVNLTGMVDGTYDLNYDLSGTNTLANQTANVVISGGIGSFTIPAANVPNTGVTTITFNTIQNSTSTCQSTLTNVTGTITINPLVDIDNTNIAVSSVCLGSNAVVDIANAINLQDGTYQFDYTIPTGTPTTGNSGDVTVTAGVGQFTIPSSVFATAGNYTLTINSITTTTGCSNTTEDANITFAVVTPLTAGTAVATPTVCASVGVMDLFALLTGEDAGGVWTDSASAVVTSPINILSFTAGTYSYTYTVTNACGTDTEVVQFTILATPQLQTVNVTVSPACLGSDVVVSLSGMVDGTYTLNYDLSGSNTLPGQSVVVTIAAGIGSFTVPTASVPNVGITVIGFTSIANNTTTCSTILTNVSAQIIIRPLADIDSANLSVTNVCFGSSIVVNISGATNLPDDVYQFNYSIPGATPTTGNSGNVTVTGGVGQFTIPSATFPTAGNYTLTVTGIVATTGCANASENATANFTIIIFASINTATITVQDTCINVDSGATITGITNLPDGTYDLTYNLTGANTATTTVSVIFTNGGTTFTIPGASCISAGQTTILLVNLTTTSPFCGVTGTGSLIGNFNVVTLGTPELIADGNLFCGLDVPAPTVANLSANIVGTPTVIWYNAPTGGTAYNDTDVLVDGTHYYATLTSANGCESGTRLDVLVDLSFCDIVIPDGFSPNNDGINDTFEIPNLAIQYPNFKLEIYNRYGNLVYTGSRNTQNWDGTTTAKGLNLGDNLLPTGVYFYILDFKDGIRKAIQGRLYLNR